MKGFDKQKIPLPKAAGAAQSSGLSTMRRISSDELLAGQRELVIEHGGDEYRLRITSKGKLILTK